MVIAVRAHCDPLDIINNYTLMYISSIHMLARSLIYHRSPAFYGNQTSSKSPSIHDQIKALKIAMFAVVCPYLSMFAFYGSDSLLLKKNRIIWKSKDSN